MVILLLSFRVLILRAVYRCTLLPFLVVSVDEFNDDGTAVAAAATITEAAGLARRVSLTAQKAAAVVAATDALALVILVE